MIIKVHIVFEAVLHMTGVHRVFCKNADESCIDFLICSDSRCQMKLFAMLRANKISGQKRNRKMIKLYDF